ncbi:MAG TPA: hypothetical protein DCO89_01070 [Clostridiales bacterium]|nr:hypothetical protein [Clostridiales bacterium]
MSLQETKALGPAKLIDFVGAQALSVKAMLLMNIKTSQNDNKPSRFRRLALFELAKGAYYIYLVGCFAQA